LTPVPSLTVAGFNRRALSPTRFRYAHHRVIRQNISVFGGGLNQFAVGRCKQ
jgi:hypothetical protein